MLTPTGTERFMEWTRKRNKIPSWRTTVLAQTDEYLHVVRMVIPWIRDDIECRLFAGHGMIHIRSTSQYGFWDFQFNRRRIGKLLRRLQTG